MESKPLLVDPQPPPMGQPPPPPPYQEPPNPNYGYSLPPPRPQPPVQPYPQPAPYQYQPGAPPPPQPTVVVHQQHQHVISNLRFGDVPVQIRCTSCQQDIVTTLRYETGLFTWLLVGLLFFFGLFLCCWIPLVIDGCKDVVHVCPRCQCVVGVYKRIG